MEKIKLYRHWYDNPKDADGNDKPNEFLGEFEVNEEEMRGYDFDCFGTKDGKKYRIIGQEVSGLADRYNAGTKIFVEELNTP